MTFVCRYYIPEDTYCPLDILVIMFEAVDGTSVPIIRIRKWSAQLACALMKACFLLIDCDFQHQYLVQWIIRRLWVLVYAGSRCF